MGLIPSGEGQVGILRGGAQSSVVLKSILGHYKVPSKPPHRSSVGTEDLHMQVPPQPVPASPVPAPRCTPSPLPTYGSTWNEPSALSLAPQAHALDFSCVREASAHPSLKRSLLFLPPLSCLRAFALAIAPA